jgi:hypothetical protein
MRLIAIICSLIFMAAPALATDTDWIEGCREGATVGLLATSPVATALSPGYSACYNADAGTDVSTVLNVGQCNTITISQWEDPDEDTTLADMATNIFFCANSAYNVNSCGAMGITPFAAGDVTVNIAASRFLVIDMGAGTAADVQRIEVLCHE